MREAKSTDNVRTMIQQPFWSPMASPRASARILRDICAVGMKSQNDRPPFLDVSPIYVTGKPYSRAAKIGHCVGSVKNA